MSSKPSAPTHSTPTTPPILSPAPASRTPPALYAVIFVIGRTPAKIQRVLLANELGDYSA